MACVLFQSFFAGSLIIVPVLSAVLIMYGMMGTLGIPLGIGTSMFGSVAIGLGVDFAIHCYARIDQNLKNYPHISSTEAISMMFPSTGRALFFNAITLGLGFALLMLSKVQPLQQFGAMVALAVGTSFLTSLCIIPACLSYYAYRPAEQE